MSRAGAAVWAVLIAGVFAAAGCTASRTASERPRTTTPPAISAPATPTGPGVSPSAGARQAQTVPRFAHIVVVLLENHAADQIIGNPAAPYLADLARSGLSLTQSYAETHPSEPNYLALFSGSTQGVTSDSCPHTFPGANLGSSLRAAGLSFTGYSEGLPSTGYTGCSSGKYARKHNPWVNFADLPAEVNQPFSAFPTDFARLPTVAFVVPDLNHDMHDGTIAEADSWLREHIGPYVAWAGQHDSLLIVTWDEDDGGTTNRIPTLLDGAHVLSGTDRTRVNHYSILRTIEDAYGLPPVGASGTAAPLSGVWQ